MFGSIVLGFFLGVFCWWLGVGIFSHVIDEDDWSPRAMRWSKYAQIISSLVSCGIYALGATSVAPIALGFQLLIVLYTHFEMDIMQFFWRRKAEKLSRELAVLIAEHKRKAGS